MLVLTQCFHNLSCIAPSILCILHYKSRSDILRIFLFLFSYRAYWAFISNAILEGHRSLKDTSTHHGWFWFILPIPPPPPSPSPPIPLSTTRDNPESGPSPLLRDVGPIFNASKHRDTKSNCTCPSPSQRDVGGSLSLNKGFGQGDTQGETQEVGGPASASRKRAMMKALRVRQRWYGFGGSLTGSMMATRVQCQLYGFNDDDKGSISAIPVQRWPHRLDDDDKGLTLAIWVRR